MSIKLEIKKRNRDYGLLTWSITNDEEVKRLFDNKDSIVFSFEGKPLKRILSYKYRKLSLGKRRVNKNENAKFFILTKKNGEVEIKVE